ncbi:alpha/beta hydrolase [Aureococcus anophagefferens]|nr:alpha/beta hydrolase [Aureococcus anophagefferens]
MIKEREEANARSAPPPPRPRRPRRRGRRCAPVEVASRRANRVIAMRDGRNLSFAEAGDPEGFPVLCFFGIGGSRYLVLLWTKSRQLGLSVISPDRPGFGRSSAWSDRAFADFARDIDTLCATLSLRRVALWGYSVGCAYAAVCALSPFVRRRLVGRLTLVSPWVPLSAPGVPLHFTFARFFPNAFAELLQPGSVKEQREQLRQRGTEAIHTGRSAEMPLSAPSTAIENFGLRGAAKSRASSPKTQAKKDTETFRADDSAELSALELHALQTLPLARVLLASIIEAQRQGARGFRDEFKLCCTDFGFKYSDLKWPARIYHGTADNLVSTTSARWLAVELRKGLASPDDVELFEVPGGTHNGMVFAILRRSLTAISRDLAPLADEPRPAKQAARAGRVPSL